MLFHTMAILWYRVWLVWNHTTLWSFYDLHVTINFYGSFYDFNVSIDHHIWFSMISYFLYGGKPGQCFQLNDQAEFWEDTVSRYCVGNSSPVIRVSSESTENSCGGPVGRKEASKHIFYRICFGELSVNIVKFLHWVLMYQAN